MPLAIRTLTDTASTNNGSFYTA